MKTPEYDDLDTIDPFSGVVYGPFTSRRLGLVLGINFFGNQKICSFDCPYCELGRTSIRMNQLKNDLSFLSAQELIEQISEKMRFYRHLPIKHILISGNGEPTLYPYLVEAIDLLLIARSEIMPEIPIVLMSNGVHLDKKRISHSLDRLDEIMIKVDAGNENVLKQINKPLVRANVGRIISAARKLKSVSCQSFFVRGVIDNTKDQMIDDWIEVVGMIKPAKVYLYSLKRVPPIKGLIAADEDTLYTIASKLKRRTQIESLVFP